MRPADTQAEVSHHRAGSVRRESVRTYDLTGWERQALGLSLMQALGAFGDDPEKRQSLMSLMSAIKAGDAVEVTVRRFTEG